MKKLVLLPVLALVLTVNAAAMEVPTDTVVQNLNGRQQVIKTYTIAPGADPQELIEDPFVLEGYRYTFWDITKEDNHAVDTVSHTETVTVESSKKDLSAILEQLAPTMEYDDGTYSGTLALDHTSIRTEAAGYAGGSKTETATKTIGPLDRNDMSYIPATTVKNGKTLALANVEWQVMGTDLVGESLVPSAYQAIATYTGKVSYNYATGYISTAEYVGEITRDEVESITYQVIYLGEEDAPAGVDAGTTLLGKALTAIRDGWPYILAGTSLVVVIVLAVALHRSRREAAELRADIETPPDDDEDKEENAE